MASLVVAVLRWNSKFAYTEEAEESYTTCCPQHLGLVGVRLFGEVSDPLHYSFGDGKTYSR